MISTYFATDQLASPQALFTALVIGLAFGFVLERAGFGSSRRLAGIFYLRDMTVLKVMFTAVITAMLGLSLVVGMGWISLDGIYNMPTVYGAQIVGGLLFGVGFVMSGWCPGTAAVGTASGKIDGLVFLGGTILGSILFNETFPVLGWLKNWGYQEETLYAFGMSRTVFGVLFASIAVGAFYFAEWVEGLRGAGTYLRSPMLKGLGLTMVVLALAMLVLPGQARVDHPLAAVTPVALDQEQHLLASIEEGHDHIDPQELADQLVAGAGDLVVVDIRPAAEYETFHIRGAINLPLAELASGLEAYKNQATIVLYSTGMTHPAQARDALARMGYHDVYMLTDGLQGFVEECLKPVSLRSEPLPPQAVAKVQKWRAYFVDYRPTSQEAAPVSGRIAKQVSAVPPMVPADWLQQHLIDPDLRIIDVRKQPAYSTSHIPGSLRIDPESFRGTVDGIPSLVMPADALANRLGLMGISPDDTVIVVADDKLRDATLVGMALSRVGHRNWAILEGGFGLWTAAGRPTDTALVAYPQVTYRYDASADDFTVTADEVASLLGKPNTLILDTRPEDYFHGEASDEARPGHIPGAVNRPYSADLGEDGQLRPIEELSAEYAKVIPSKDTQVVVHCRTGHQASQTYFVLKHLLGYQNVKWYDGSWTDWAARLDLPAVSDTKSP